MPYLQGWDAQWATGERYGIGRPESPFHDGDEIDVREGSQPEYRRVSLRGVDDWWGIPSRFVVDSLPVAVIGTAVLSNDTSGMPMINKLMAREYALKTLRHVKRTESGFTTSDNEIEVAEHITATWCAGFSHLGDGIVFEVMEQLLEATRMT